jgi:hypothetical protein
MFTTYRYKFGTRPRHGGAEAPGAREPQTKETNTMAKQIDLQAQNMMAVRREAKYGTSANGKSGPAVFEVWALHLRTVSDKNEAMPGKQMGTTTLRKRANKWAAIVGGGTPGRLGEASRLLASRR